MIGTDNDSKLSVDGINMCDNYTVNINNANGHAYSMIGSIDKE